MATCQPPASMQIVVNFERRPDGGLRAYCNEVPGFILSNRDPDKVMGAVEDVLEVILSEMLGQPVKVTPLVGVTDAIEHRVPAAPAFDQPLNYVGIPLAA